MSIAAGQSEYAATPAPTLPAVIRSEKENERCSALLEALNRKAEKLTAAERRLKAASPAEVWCELLESNGLKHKDRLDIFDTPSIASEVLCEKRLTGEQICELSRHFHVSPEVFF